MNLERLKGMLQRHEGLQLDIYVDTLHNWTIGYGHKIEGGAFPLKYLSLLSFYSYPNQKQPEPTSSEEIFECLITHQAHLTLEGADKLLVDDINFVISRLNKYQWFLSLEEVRQEIIVDFTFNLGLKGLFKFKKMVYALQNGNYEEAALEMADSLWAKQVGSRAIELIAMMQDGKYL